MMSDVLLQANDVSKSFGSASTLFGSSKQVQAVSQVSLEIRRGETFAIVGESGCGKSTLSRLLLDLLPLSGGQVVFEGTDISTLSASGKREFRRKAQMVFQDPFASLNPRMKVADIIGEPIWLENKLSNKQRRERVLELMAQVGLRPDQADLYPHEFSGGQRQRIGIARAIAGNPKLIIGDEPVSALDVSVQAQIINLLESLKRDLDLTLIIVAHDLVVVRHMSDRVAVMYLGEIVEVGPVESLYVEPLHPYTQSLLDAVPVAMPEQRRAREPLEGDLPDAANAPSGCRFHTRCPHAREKCSVQAPVLQTSADNSGRQVACHFWKEIFASRTAAPAEPIMPGKLKQRLAAYRKQQELKLAVP